MEISNEIIRELEVERMHVKMKCWSQDLFLFRFLFVCDGPEPVGRAKKGEPREKTSGTPASRTWLVSNVPHVVSNPHQTQRLDDRMVKRGNEISALLTTRPHGPLEKCINLQDSTSFLCTVYIMNTFQGYLKHVYVVLTNRM